MNARFWLHGLRVSIVLLGLAIIASGLALVWVVDRQHQAEQRLAESMRTKEAGSAELVRALRDEQEIVAYVTAFSELTRDGLLGQERRLDWIEMMRALHKRLRLGDLSIEFAPQGALDRLYDAPDSGRFRFFASRMNIQGKLLHEGDLLRWLAGMHEAHGAIVSPRQCTLERLDFEPSDWLAPRLRVQCSIDWITLRATDQNG
ncbi:MAG: hypothetical protein AMXMBFR6_13840 [Betaproteobacteria bacterium]|jgi:hypothetical protein|nr:hypothetical protein [Rhodocyclaceae bacterium]MCG3186160.1 hypothetical protein [Rhodocyclaceae bacterium]